MVVVVAVTSTDNTASLSLSPRIASILYRMLDIPIPFIAAQNRIRILEPIIPQSATHGQSPSTRPQLTYPPGATVDSFLLFGFWTAEGERRV